MQLKDINLNFLWEAKRYIVLDRRDPFEEKWEEEMYKLMDYINNATAEQIVELFIVVNKDKLARQDYWMFSETTLEAIKAFYEDDVYSISPGKYIRNKKFTKVKKRFVKLKIGATIIKEIVLEFPQSLDLKSLIETTLAGKTYTTITNDNVVEYKIQKCPIEKLIVSEKSFAIFFNEAFYKELG